MNFSSGFRQGFSIQFTAPSTSIQAPCVMPNQDPTSNLQAEPICFCFLSYMKGLSWCMCAGKMVYSLTSCPQMLSLLVFSGRRVHRVPGAFLLTSCVNIKQTSNMDPLIHCFYPGGKLLWRLTFPLTPFYKKTPYNSSLFSRWMMLLL